VVIGLAAHPPHVEYARGIDRPDGDCRRRLPRPGAVDPGNVGHLACSRAHGRAPARSSGKSSDPPPTGTPCVRRQVEWQQGFVRMARGPGPDVRSPCGVAGRSRDEKTRSPCTRDAVAASRAHGAVPRAHAAASRAPAAASRAPASASRAPGSASRAPASAPCDSASASCAPASASCAPAAASRDSALVPIVPRGSRCPFRRPPRETRSRSRPGRRKSRQGRGDHRRVAASWPASSATMARTPRTETERP